MWCPRCAFLQFGFLFLQFQQVPDQVHCFQFRVCYQYRQGLNHLQAKSSLVSFSFHFYPLALRTKNIHILRLLTCIFSNPALKLRRNYCHFVNLQEDAFVAHFKYHTGAITSVEWSPHEASTFSITSTDHLLMYEYSPL